MQRVATQARAQPHLLASSRLLCARALLCLLGGGSSNAGCRLLGAGRAGVLLLLLRCPGLRRIRCGGAAGAGERSLLLQLVERLQLLLRSGELLLRSGELLLCHFGAVGQLCDQRVPRRGGRRRLLLHALQQLPRLRQPQGRRWSRDCRAWCPASEGRL